MNALFITPLALTITALLVVLCAALSLLLALGVQRQLLIAAVRMTAQLLLVGLFLRQIFAISSIWLTGLVICAMLERLNYKVSLVADGAEAVRALQKMPYDIVLMDVMMPVMDGVAATEAIRALPLPFSGVPILGLTAHASKEDHDSYRKSGMNDVMSKPVTKQALEAALAAHLA